jgi:hypothetical protein
VLRFDKLGRASKQYEGLKRSFSVMKNLVLYELLSQRFSCAQYLFQLLHPWRTNVYAETNRNIRKIYSKRGTDFERSNQPPSRRWQGVQIHMEPALRACVRKYARLLGFIYFLNKVCTFNIGVYGSFKMFCRGQAWTCSWGKLVYLGLCRAAYQVLVMVLWKTCSWESNPPRWWFRADAFLAHDILSSGVCVCLCSWPTWCATAGCFRTKKCIEVWLEGLCWEGGVRWGGSNLFLLITTVVKRLFYVDGCE